MGYDPRDITYALDALAMETYQISEDHGFHDGEDDNNLLKSFMRLALIHTEVAEATEELRHAEVDWDKFADELADIIIRVVDLAEVHDLSIGDAVVQKMEKNRGRPYKHGKAY